MIGLGEQLDRLIQRGEPQHAPGLLVHAREREPALVKLRAPCGVEEDTKARRVDERQLAQVEHEQGWSPALGRDQMLDQLRKSPTRLDGVALIARGRSFEPHLLGEISGWPGVRKELNKRYRDTGRLLWWLDGVSAA